MRAVRRHRAHTVATGLEHYRGTVSVQDVALSVVPAMPFVAADCGSIVLDGKTEKSTFMTWRPAFQRSLPRLVAPITQKKELADSILQK